MSLTSEEAYRVNTVLNSDGEVLTGSVASLYVAEFSQRERKLKDWRNANVEGLLCLVMEFATGKYFFMVFDRETYNTMYEIEVYDGINYRECYENFHAFETSDGYVGFGFASTRAAKKFYSVVTEKASDPSRALNGLFFNEDGSINAQRLPSTWKKLLRDAGFRESELLDPAMSGLIIQCLEEVGISTQAPERGLTREQMAAKGFSPEQMAQYERYERELKAYELEVSKKNKKGKSPPPAPPRRRNKSPMSNVNAEQQQGVRQSGYSGFEMASQFSTPAQSLYSAPGFSTQSSFSEPYGGVGRPRIVGSPQDALAANGVRKPPRPYGVSAQSAPIPSPAPRYQTPAYAQSAPGGPPGGRSAYNSPAFQQQPKRTSLTQKLRNSLRRMSRSRAAEQARPVPGAPPSVAPRPNWAEGSKSKSPYERRESPNPQYRPSPERSRMRSPETGRPQPSRTPRERTRQPPAEPRQRTDRSREPRRADRSREPRRTDPNREPRRTERRRENPEPKLRRKFGDDGRYPGGTILRNSPGARGPPLPPALPALPTRQNRAGFNEQAPLYPKPNFAKLRTSVLPDLGGVQRSQQDNLKARLRERLNERRKRIADSDDED